MYISLPTFKKALRPHGTLLAVSLKHVATKCPCFVHAGQASGTLTINRLTQKGSCNLCGLVTDSFSDVAARYERAKVEQNKKNEMRGRINPKLVQVLYEAS
jgi:hypothetical protein